MKKLVVLSMCFVMGVSTLAFAGNDLTRTGGSSFGQSVVQFFAPLSAAALSVASSTTNMTNYILYKVTAGASGTCYMRVSPASAKTGTQVLIPASTTHTFAKNVDAKFVNFSGCTSGYLQLQ